MIWIVLYVSGAIFCMGYASVHFPYDIKFVLVGLMWPIVFPIFILFTAGEFLGKVFE